MADLSPTQQVIVTANRLTSSRAAAVTLATNDVVFLDASNEWDLAECDATALEAGSNQIGLVVTGAAAAAFPVVLTGNAEINLGTSIGTKSDEIVVSSTAGNMHPKGDLASTEYYTRLGYMKTADVLMWEPRVTGIVK